MIKKHLKVLIITSLLILLPIVAGVVLWDRLPTQMPTHWNARGEVDGWGSKGFFVFGLPLILLGAQWICIFATSADPKKEAHADKVVQVVLWLMPVLSIVLQTAGYMSALGLPVRIERIMPLLLGFLFVVIGNYMPKCKQNYTIGIKLPWTLNSTENWNRTHRFAGWVWVAGGIGMMLSAFWGGFWLLMGIAFVMTLVPVIYSFILYRKGI